MLYKDEKFKQIIRRESRVLWQTAQASKKRTYLLGGLATLAWVSFLIQLPPIQRARSVVPHLVMLGVAHAISKSVAGNLQKTTDIQKKTVALAKALRFAQNNDDLRSIYSELTQLGREFIIKSYREKD